MPEKQENEEKKVADFLPPRWHLDPQGLPGRRTIRREDRPKSEPRARSECHWKSFPLLWAHERPRDLHHRAGIVDRSVDSTCSWRRVGERSEHAPPTRGTGNTTACWHEVYTGTRIFPAAKMGLGVPIWGTGEGGKSPVLPPETAGSEAGPGIRDLGNGAY